MPESQWRTTCYSPFERHNHSSIKKYLRPVTKWMCNKAPSISMGSKICDDCRKKLAKTSSIPTIPQDIASESDVEPEGDVFTDVSETLASLNQCLGVIGETPVCKPKLHQTKYTKQKIKKITTAMKKTVIGDVPSEDTDDEGEMIKQLKQKFHTTTFTFA